MIGLLPDLGPLGRAGFCALLAALALAPILGGLPSGPTYGSDPALGLLRILVLLAALCLSIQPPPSHPGRGHPEGARGVRAAVWTLLGLTLASLLVHSRFLTSPVLLFAMLPATLDWLCYALVFTLALTLVRDRKALLLLVEALLVGAAWVALKGAGEYGDYVQAGSPQGRVQATFVSPNFAAGFLGLCLPIAAAAFLRARSNLLVVITGLCAALTAGVLVATGSRLGIAAAGAGLGAAFLMALIGGLRLPWGRIGALAAAALLLGWGFRGPITNRVSGGAGGQEHSGAFRSWTWRGTLAMVRANPVLGTGPGTYEFRYPAYARVAKTNLAHSSYLQLAAEQGLPALAAAGAALALTLLAGLRVLRRPPDEAEAGATRRLLLCGLYGGLVAGVLRSAIDSEWSLLGNALPFWAVAGLVAAPTPTPPSPGGREEGAGRRHPEGTRGVGLLLALAITTVLFFNALRLQGAMALRRESPAAALARAEKAAQAWPRDPAALALLAGLVGGERATALYREAARVEPSGRRFFQLGRHWERQGRHAEAVTALERARAAEPTYLQTLRALAEAQERQGDRAAALATWRELARRHEGPAGRIRALPELPETHPAWAYAALAGEAAARGEGTEAAALYEKAAAVVEDYADTTPTYQVMETALAQLTGANLAERRQELRALYEKVTDALLAARPDQTGTLRRRRQETLDRLDKFMTADITPGQGGS